MPRTERSKVNIRLIQRAHKSMLICDSCPKPRLALHGWETNAGPRNVSPARWPCRACAGLSYASEGQALHIRRLFPDLKPFSHLMQKPNPGPWEPLAFASPWTAVDAGLVSRSSEMPDEVLEVKNPQKKRQPSQGNKLRHRTLLLLVLFPDRLAHMVRHGVKFAEPAIIRRDQKLPSSLIWLSAVTSEARE